MTQKRNEAYQMVQLLKNDLGDTSDAGDSLAQTKTKKSLFATLMKGPKLKITKKIEQSSTIKLENDVSASSDQETSEMGTEDILPKKKKNKQLSVFKKIVKKSKGADKHLVKSLTTNKLVATSYFPKWNIKLINGINELQGILHNLYHSEQHVIYLLKKYVEDPSVQKQLFESSFEYFALQYDAKTLTNALTEKMWAQETENLKLQEFDFQKRLNEVIATNRDLELQIEQLHRRCEKITARANAYPKNFLHMKSFGKQYARQLIDNNRKLQKKMQALTAVICDFEAEIQKLQHQKRALEEEKRGFRLQLGDLEAIIEKQKDDFELERSGFGLKLNHDRELLKDVDAIVQMIYQDLHNFDCELRQVGIQVVWPKMQCQDACLPEMIAQIRTCITELFFTIMTAYRDLTEIAKEVSKLRTTNARLQENLQKSTSELDNLSRKLEKNVTESENNSSNFEAKYYRLQQENFSLTLKMESCLERNESLKKQIEDKEKSISESEENINKLVVQNERANQTVDEILSKIETPTLNTLQEKIDFLKTHYCQIVGDRNNLHEKYNNVVTENQSLIQLQSALEQDLATLHDGLTLLSAENDTIKKQFETEHQTVLTLQNERLKYLEEKNVLKTVFQHLKNEVSRIQQLEGAVVDMNKETSRLSLIAEFNKQIGEQLKNEVEIKDHTILELRNSLEQLSHMQLDNDKEKRSLCVQLSEISTVKNKLSDCLEIELKKNLDLDESRRQLQSSTQSQLQIYEEMQKSERTALRELLKDFKGLVKQRDCLVLMKEESKKKIHALESQLSNLKQENQEALKEIEKKEERIKRVLEKVTHREEKLRIKEENHNYEIMKYEKNIRKLEKLLAQKRNERTEVEASNIHLKNILEKTKMDLSEAKEKFQIADSKLSAKVSECQTLEAELSAYKNELQVLNQEHGKSKLEIEYLTKMHQEQTTELKQTVSSLSSKETNYMEAQNRVLNKDHRINELNKMVNERDVEIRKLDQQCSYLRQQTEDQNKIMIGYENQLVLLQDIEAGKMKVEKELHTLHLEYSTILSDLEHQRKENDRLKNEISVLLAKNENEKTYYKNQTNEIILDYSEQKAGIEQEIDHISRQLLNVTENLHREKVRFDELAKAHDELKSKYVQVKDNLNTEVSERKETTRRIEDMEMCIQSLTNEKEDLQRRVNILILDVNEEKNANNQWADDNRKLEMILEQGKQQYAVLFKRNTKLEDEVSSLKDRIEKIMRSNDTSALQEKDSALKAAKERIQCMDKELKDSQKLVLELKEDIFRMQQHVTALEFKNCELTLQLHESHMKLETERNLFKELKNDSPEQTPPLAHSDCGELFY